MKKEISSKIVAFVFLLVISALIIFLNSLGYLNGVKNGALYAAVPTQGIFQTSLADINDFFQTIESIGKFKKENATLKNENLKLTYEISKCKETKRENEILKRQLDFSEDLCLKGACFQWEMGRIIGRDPNNYGKYIIINLGTKNGVKENQAVVISGGVLIGKVVEVFSNSSKVMLITSSDSLINSIAQTTRANGIVKGKYATGAKLEMINQNEELISDDLVITSGLESRIPKGLLIGKISNIKESANKVFKFADLNLFADFNQIEEIFIVKNYD
ncbi:MAG: rod shape-determining protein MreC [Patescibacteria group bacterium]|nr:rod shape-determining protein MreC [Patescibacteria group bacterium]